MRASRCVALVCLDTERIRSTARAAYERRLADVKILDARLRVFEYRDQPAFGAWVQATFATEISELHSILNRADRIGQSIFMAFEEAAISGRFPASLWRDPDVEGMGSGADSDGIEDEGEDPAARTEGGAARPEEDEGADDPFGGRGGPGPFDRWLDPRRSRGAGSMKDGCTRLYRALVRRLHPDHHGAMNAETAELWHRAQAAYRDRDWNALEDCRLACEGIEARTSRHVRVSLLRELAEAAEHRIKILRGKIGKLKRHPAWGFCALTDRSRLMAKVHRELREDLEAARSQLQALEMEVDDLRQDSRRVRRRRIVPRAEKPSAGYGQNPWF